MIVTNAADYMGGSDEQGRPVDEEKLPNSRHWRVYSLAHIGTQATSAGSTTVVQLVLSTRVANDTGQIILHTLQLVKISVGTVE